MTVGKASEDRYELHGDAGPAGAPSPSAPRGDGHGHEGAAAGPSKPPRAAAGRPWWQRSKGAAFMLFAAALIMGAMLTLWSVLIAPSATP